MDKAKSGLLIIAGEPKKDSLPPLKPMKGMTSAEHSELEQDDPEEKAEKPLYEIADLLRERLGLDCDPADYGAILKGLKAHIGEVDGTDEEETEEDDPTVKKRSAEASMADGDIKDVY